MLLQVSHCILHTVPHTVLPPAVVRDQGSGGRAPGLLWIPGYLLEPDQVPGERVHQLDRQEAGGRHPVLHAEDGQAVVLEHDGHRGRHQPARDAPEEARPHRVEVQQGLLLLLLPDPADDLRHHHPHRQPGLPERGHPERVEDHQGLAQDLGAVESQLEDGGQPEAEVNGKPEVLETPLEG